jgi:dTMP kinase
MKFIVFEGLDGAGKSTLIEALKLEVQTKGQTALLTREPGGSALGDEIRELLLRTRGEAPVPRAELLLYQAARAQHVDTKIRPALKRGEWVLCDRYTASSVAFQAGGRQLPRTDIDWLNNYATDGCVPDLWVLLDLSTEEASRRMKGRELDRFEKEAQDFHERVRQAYLGLAKEQKSNWLVLDASEDRETLRQKLLQALRERGWL